MTSKAIKCFRCVDGKNLMVKNGKTKSGNQRYLCKICLKTKVATYIYKAWNQDVNQKIILFTKEGLGIRSTARLLKISTTTLLKRIITIAKGIHQPIISKGKTYEVDEMCTYICHKRNFSWIVLALERETKRIVTFSVGKRTNKTLSRVLDILKLSVAKKIFTDRLKNYRYLIEEKFHSIKRFATNYVERLNLTLRTHLKRLNRRTICFSRSCVILTAVLRINFWG